MLEQLQAGHFGHVPIGYYQVDLTAVQNIDRCSTVLRLNNVLEVQIAEDFSDDSPHRQEIIHNEHC